MIGEPRPLDRLCLAAPPNRLPLLEKRGDAFSMVLASEEPAHRFEMVAHVGVGIPAEATIEHSFCFAGGERSAPGHCRRQLKRPIY